MSVNSFKRVFLCSDVTCVKCVGDYVFAGIGGNLKIFKIGFDKCIREVEIFRGHQIHGIQPIDSKTLIIFGAKKVVVINIEIKENELLVAEVASHDFGDWILCSHWLSNENRIAIITAHNVLWLWSWQVNASPISTVKCTEKCILYSAHMCGTNCKDSVVFCGTVFREIVLWVPSESSECDQPVLHRLRGHHGVIFSISWNQENSLLCSTSDDRSVRTWKVTFTHKGSWRNSSISLLHVFYGHTARVWKSLVLHDVVISCGEDSQICVWDQSGLLMHKWERRRSGCIWSIDYSEQHKLLVAGGGDGSIQLFPLSFPFSSPTPSSCWSEHLIPPSDCVRKLCILHSGSIIAVTESGILLALPNNRQNSWEIVCQDCRFANYCLLSVSHDKTRFSLASLKGHIVVYQDLNFVCCLDQSIDDCKILSLLWLSEDEFLVCDDGGILTVWKMDSNIDKSVLTRKATFVLPYSRERLPTAAIIARCDNTEFLVCGDRCGSLHLYKFTVENDPNVSEPLLSGSPCHTLFKIHGRLGVTSILKFHEKIFSTGRDGILRCFIIRDSKLYLVFDEKMNMDWISKILICQNLPPLLPSLFVVGFKEKNMTVWYAKERCLIMNFECGGGHRSWDCFFNDGSFEVAYVRDKQVFTGSWPVRNIMQPSIQQGMLANEINCLLHISSSPNVVAFGGEDGTILMVKFSCNHSHIKNTAVLTSHISSIRCLCKYGNILFSAGGRAQLKAWCVEKERIDSFSFTEIGSFMLKGDHKPHTPLALCGPSVDPEMRFMNICCISFESGNLLLACGCSDGVIRFLNFNTTSKSFSVIGESSFHGRCILKVSSITLPSGKTFLLSAATDGIIALWNISEDLNLELEMNPFWSKRVHQSGVNSIHMNVLNSGKEEPLILIASGGDDNVMVLFVIQIADSQAIMHALWQSKSTHAAQITGVWIVDKWLISTSVDQRLTMWHWSFSSSPVLNSLTCKFISQCVCHVPDIHDMQIWEESQGIILCVAGKGTEIFYINLEEANNEDECLRLCN